MKYFYGAGGGGAGFVSIVAFGFSVGLETPAFPPVEIITSVDRGLRLLIEIQLCRQKLL